MAEYIESKKHGDIGENEILKIIKKKHKNAYIDDKKKAFSKWDIYIPETKYGVEVKMDLKSKETGNILIEVMFGGKLSALSLTEAKYWVFITGYRYIWIKPIEIYRFLEQHPQYNRLPITGNGDTKEKIAYLINHDVFVKYVYKLDKEKGYVEMINEKELMYYDNFINYINENKL